MVTGFIDSSYNDQNDIKKEFYGHFQEQFGL